MCDKVSSSALGGSGWVPGATGGPQRTCTLPPGDWRVNNGVESIPWIRLNSPPLFLIKTERPNPSPARPTNALRARSSVCRRDRAPRRARCAVATRLGVDRLVSARFLAAFLVLHHGSDHVDRHGLLPLRFPYPPSPPAPTGGCCPNEETGQPHFRQPGKPGPSHAVSPYQLADRSLHPAAVMHVLSVVSGWGERRGAMPRLFPHEPQISG